MIRLLIHIHRFLLSVLAAAAFVIEQAESAEQDSALAIPTAVAEKFPFLAKVPRVRPADEDYVVIVHGLTWARPTMKAMGRYLHKEGYHTVEIHYPSRSIPVEEVVSRYLLPAVQENCPDPGRRIHFVGHSMGCIVIRQLLASHRFENLGNVVLLAAPNHGCELADFFTQSPPLRKFLGPAVHSLGVARDSLPNQLGPADFSPGIIMGTKSRIPFVSKFIPGEDDGVIRVSSGAVAGMAEMIVLPVSHVHMPSAPEVCGQTTCFLRNGRFDGNRLLAASARPTPKIRPIPQPKPETKTKTKESP